MANLSNPLRFSIRDRTVDVENFLRHEDFSTKHVTEIAIRPSEGNVYIHWEEDDE